MQVNHSKSKGNYRAQCEIISPVCSAASGAEGALGLISSNGISQGNKIMDVKPKERGKWKKS